MQYLLKRRNLRLTKEDIQHLSCFFYNEFNGLLATAFFNFPLPLKRHCVQVGVTAGQMALHAPDSAIPERMTREEYANAVRYGCLYHDIGAYLVYNQREMYPNAGERFLREELSEDTINPAAKRVILEIVQFCGERYDGQGYPYKLAGDAIPLHAGICAVADEIDVIISERRGLFSTAAEEAKRFVSNNKGTAFCPGAVECFTAAYNDVDSLYRHWHKQPPLWDNRDIKPLDRPINQSIG